MGVVPKQTIKKSFLNLYKVTGQKKSVLNMKPVFAWKGDRGPAHHQLLRQPLNLRELKAASR